MRHRNSTPDHRVSEEVQKAEASWFWPIKSREQALETVRDVSTLLFDAAFFDKMSSQWREEQNRSEIAHLRGLDLGGLRARWQGVFRRPAPSHLTRHLLFAVIAYRLQADRFGDLDQVTLQVLDGTAAKEAGPAMSARLASFDQKRTELTPGTVLVREWDRQSQRVMVLADGFAWNGQTYDSLSKVALAITGTRWNGPRFFGLRDRDDGSTTGPRS